MPPKPKDRVRRFLGVSTLPGSLPVILTELEAPEWVDGGGPAETSGQNPRRLFAIDAFQVGVEVKVFRPPVEFHAQDYEQGV